MKAAIQSAPLLINIILFLATLYTHTAIFTVHNHSTSPITIEHTWQSEDLETIIQPNTHYSFNTGFANVERIRWRIFIAETIRIFNVPVHVSFLNLGGWFDIYNNGDYRYYFGVNGSGSGTAPAQ